MEEKNKHLQEEHEREKEQASKSDQETAETEEKETFQVPEVGAKDSSPDDAESSEEAKTEETTEKAKEDPPVAEARAKDSSPDDAEAAEETKTEEAAEKAKEDPPVAEAGAKDSSPDDAEAAEKAKMEEAKEDPPVAEAGAKDSSPDDAEAAEEAKAEEAVSSAGKQAPAGPEGDDSKELSEKEKVTPIVGWLNRVGEKITGSATRLPVLRKVPLKKLGPLKTALGTISAVILMLAASLFLVTGVLTGNTSADILSREPEPIKWTFTYGDKKWETDLRKMGFDGKDPKTLDREKWGKWFEKVAKDVEEPAVDAKLERLGSEIEEEKEGSRILVDQVEKWLTELPKGVNKPRQLPVEKLKPKVTVADLEQVDQKQIGRYTTRYNAGEFNRTTNVRLSSQAINNLVLNPGEEFSFNETVGQRTAERGYKNAKVIVNGEFVDGMGGGICQTSSTLFNSVDIAGLEVTSRSSHSKEVTYVPRGRDATVAWYGPDFKFRNSLSKPILIKSSANGGYLTVEVYTAP